MLLSLLFFGIFVVLFCFRLGSRHAAQAMAAPHSNRDTTVKLLEALKAGKIKRVADLRNAEIAAALTDVVAKVGWNNAYRRSAYRVNMITIYW